MERNPTDNLGTPGAGASSLGAGTDSLSVTGQGLGQNATSGAYAGTASDTNAGLGTMDLGGSTGGSMGGSAGGAQGKVDQARQAATDALGQARDKATAFKSTLADRLESGANSLRQQAQGGAQPLAGSTGGGATLMQNDQVQRLAGPAADAMQRTADFLRNGDLQETIEQQVRTNPGRTLLIALGVGYVLGKALRR